MNLADANLTFPVLIIARKTAEVGGAWSLRMLQRPVKGQFDFKGAELVDAVWRRFAINSVIKLERGAPDGRRADYELEPLEPTSLDEVKARIAQAIRARPEEWCNMPEHVWEELTALENATDMAGLLVATSVDGFHLDRNDNALFSAAIAERPQVLSPPALPPLPTVEGPTIGPVDADLTFPIIGFSHGRHRMVAARDFAAFTKTYKTAATSGELVGLEVVDSDFKRFRVAAVRVLGPDAPAGLTWLVGLVRAIEHRLDYDLEALPPTTLDAVKTRAIAGFKADPWGWTSDFRSGRSNAEIKRILAAKDLWALSARLATSPFACHPKPEPVPLWRRFGRVGKASGFHIWLLLIAALIVLIFILTLIRPA